MVEPTDPTRTATDATLVPDADTAESPEGAETLDLDTIERDLDEVERTLGQLADGTYWSEREQPGPTGADDQSGAPA